MTVETGERRESVPVTGGMLTLEEVMLFLEVDKNEIERYVQKKKLSPYKIGGAYLRFRKEEVQALKKELRKALERPRWYERFFEFWKFNNFYVITLLVIVALLVWFWR